MYEGRQYDNWNHTAAIMALTCNVNRTSKSRSYEVADFHPLMQRQRGTVINKSSISMLKAFVPKENLPGGGD